MTALAAQRTRSVDAWGYHQFTLASGNKAWKGGQACIDLTTGKVVPGAASTSLFVIGMFTENVDATSADALVNVDLGREVKIEWLVNGTGTIAATDVGNLCYIQDDQTVTITPTGASVAGRVWAVEAVRGVAVERLQAVPAGVGTLDALTAVSTTLAAFSSNNINVGNNPHSGALYDVPTTGAASTITLPATAVDGTVLYFTADGTKNGHTVQYRDATGPTNLTTALTASKRHMVVCAFKGSNWYANAYVSP